MKVKVSLPYIFNNYYKTSRSFVITNGDNDKGELIANGITKRDSNYSLLLENFRKIMRARSIIKEIHKWLFFWIIVIVGVVLGIYLFNVVNMLIYNIKNIDISKLYVSLISSSVSLISIIISIPIIITKYLFNSKEDDNITTIISKTQEHDSLQMNLLSSRFVGPNDNKLIEDRNLKPLNIKEVQSKEENKTETKKYDKIIESIQNLDELNTEIK